MRPDVSTVTAYVCGPGSGLLAARLARAGPVRTARYACGPEDVPQDATLVVVGDPALVARVREVRPGALLVVACHGPDASTAARLLLSGAHAVVDLDADDETLAAGMRAAVSDGSFVPRCLQADVVEQLFDRRRRGPREAARLTLLTPREREILDLLAAGQDRTDIAHLLHESVHQVRVRIDRMKAKLGVTTQRQAVAVLDRVMRSD